MTKNINLTEGSITEQIIKLSMPIMGTSFMQMAYNLINMIWLGRVGSHSVAAVGIASYFTWLGISIMLIARIGAEVGISQSIGAQDKVKASLYARNAATLVIIFAMIYGFITWVFAVDLISFFKIQENEVSDAAVSYLRIISLGSIFFYSIPTFAGIFNGTGNSKLPFRLIAIGLLSNILLDPLLIFGLGPIPAMGSNGAAIATIFSQFLVVILFLNKIKHGKLSLGILSLKPILRLPLVKSILKLGLPVAVHSVLFASFAMILTRIISPWGALPIAVQSVGAQIEALSWMTASGFSTALGVFTGQNFGAGKWNRIFKGFYTTIIISGTLGILATVSFLLFGKEIFTLFLPEPLAISLGVQYLSILAISQFFICIEISTGGVFNGIGKTIPPSAVGITLTGFRIPLAIFLSQPFILGMTGVWWSITITSVLKGIILFMWFYIIMRSHPEYKPQKIGTTRFIRLYPTRIRQDFFDTNTKLDDEN